MLGKKLGRIQLYDDYVNKNIAGQASGNGEGRCWSPDQQHHD